MTIRELIDNNAGLRAESAFLIGPEDGEVVTYAKLQEQSRAISAQLGKLGLKPGDKVAFLLNNGLYAAQLFLGSMYGGLVAVPLNVRAGVSQLTYTLDHCDAEVVYVEEEYCSLLNEVLVGVRRTVRVFHVDTDSIAKGQYGPVSSMELKAPAPEDAALLMYTSGSTGQPKAAIHTHRTILAGAENSVRAHQLSPPDRSLLVLPLYHINAECVTLVPTLLSGGSVVVPRRFSVSQFWDWLDDYHCTWSAVVPTIVSQLLDWQDPKADQRRGMYRRIRFLRSSSAPLAPALHREFLEKFDVLLIQAMGSSEAGNVFSNPLPPGENKIGSPGLPWGFEVKLVDRDSAEASPGEPGEMLIRGAALTRGYYKEPEATAAAFAEGWLHTGDLAYRDQDGYFFVIGRSKELIIKGGVNIAPRQIDDVLESHPAVLEAAAIGVPDRHLGEDISAFVVLRKGITCDERELLEFCERRLGHFKIPTRIHFAEDLPKGPSGKVQRLQLTEKAAHLARANSAPFGSQFQTFKGMQTSEKAPPSQSWIEQTIAGSWAEVLSVSDVDCDSNFFALGGHSLLAVQCVSLLRERIPVILSLSDFFEHATVAAQVGLVIGRWSARSQMELASYSAQSAIQMHSRDEPAPLSSGQRRLWFLDQLNPGSGAYNESDAFRLKGQLDAEALERALNVIVDRHEILRTTIEGVRGEPVAVVHESWPLRIRTFDLTTLTGVEQKRESERLLAEEPMRPYRLDVEPGIRVALLRFSAEDHLLILMMHHIICDWSSEGILWREMASLYRSFKRGEEPALKPLTIQHGDYAAWQARREAETDFTGDLAFWEEALRGASDLLELPADRTRPAVPSYKGARQRLFLNSSLSQALRNLGKQTETTLFSVFAAALNALFHRYTGADDISLGVPVADRERPELQSVIGFLLQTQVLRTRLAGDITFRDLLCKVQKGVLELYLHRGVPFDRVVSRLRPERNLSYSPLFQVMLIGRDPDQMLSFTGIDGLTVEPAYGTRCASKFDMTLFVTDCGDEIWLELEYSTELFDDVRVAQMLGHYQTLLESVAFYPEQLLRDLPLLTEAERKCLLEWNDTGMEFEAGACIHALFEAQAKRAPRAIAVELAGQRLSYGELDRKSSCFARNLQNLGVGPGVVVAVYTERSLAMVTALLGILRAGGAYLPIDLNLPQERIEFMMSDAQPRVVVTTASLLKGLPPHQAMVVCVDNVTAGEELLPTGGTEPFDLAYIMYTSGSTGKPKGVEVRHRSVVNFLDAMRQEPGLEPQDTLLSVTTLSFDIFGLELWLPLTTGARVVIVPQHVARDGRALSDALQSSGATVMQATPATWRLLLEGGWEGSSRLKILCGGESWTSELAEQLLPKCSSLWNMYGPTETTIWSAVTQVELGKPVVIGRPIANTRFYVVDANLHPVPVGVPGELLIGGEGVARGYLNRPELTQEKFIVDLPGIEAGSRLYRTGDLVRWRAGGQLEFLGRLDHQVKIRGFRIELGEIESTLRTHPGLKEAVVTIRDDVAKQLVAYVIPGDDPACTADELRQFLKHRLPDYMIPVAFVMLPELPLTPNGKVDRKSLPRPGAEEEKPEIASASPKGETEEKIAAIWQKVLAIPRVGRSHNFFDLGGDSLRLLKVNGLLRETFQKDIPMVDMFRFTTVHAMANYLTDGADSNAVNLPLADNDLRQGAARRRRLRLQVSRESAKSYERQAGY